MTPEAQRIAIAEACGYHNVRVINNTVFGVPDGVSDECGNDVIVPDYPKDTNAVRGAWEKLTDDQRFVFRIFLMQIAQREKIWSEEALFEFGSEAFLRTIGKWDDSK